MPNRPRPDNPARSVRVDDELWEAAMRVAMLRGENLSEKIREFLRRYVQQQEGPS